MSGTGPSKFQCVRGAETRHREQGLFDLQLLFYHHATTHRRTEITLNIHLVIDVCQSAHILEIE